MEKIVLRARFTVTAVALLLLTAFSFTSSSGPLVTAHVPAIADQPPQLSGTIGAGVSDGTAMVTILDFDCFAFTGDQVGCALQTDTIVTGLAVDGAVRFWADFNCNQVGNPGELVGIDKTDASGKAIKAVPASPCYIFEFIGVCNQPSLAEPCRGIDTVGMWHHAGHLSDPVNVNTGIVHHGHEYLPSRLP